MVLLKILFISFKLLAFSSKDPEKEQAMKTSAKAFASLQPIKEFTDSMGRYIKKEIPINSTVAAASGALIISAAEGRISTNRMKFLSIRHDNVKMAPKFEYDLKSSERLGGVVLTIDF